MPTRLDISIGPVQGFIEQSRRTRDLWGSSYLLSFLTAHAITGAKKAGAEVIVPRVETDPLYQWVSGKNKDTKRPPQLGSLPNHLVFQVETGIDPAEVANSGLQRFLEAWQRVCDAVWQRFMEHAATSGNGVGEIWSRQTGGFWELTWTAGAGALLARRKHWRSHRLPDEPGDKCTVIHDLQELSGYVRAESSGSRERQDRFWERVRGRLGRLHLREDERLSAIAFVKRLFPLVDDRALGWSVDGSRWPSTVHIAARPWVRRVIVADPVQARQYAKAVQDKASNVLSEHLPTSDGVDPAVAGDFGRLDGNFLHSETVQRNANLCPLNDDAPPGSRDELARLLEDIYALEDANGRRLEGPPMFYALLLADGDRLGRLVGELGGDVVGKALSKFTGGVPGIVDQHGRVAVYAGGDDVLAMLPLERALQCAASVAEGYRSAFPERGGGTLSAAVVFAHVREPLSGVIAEAHRLLDDVAKEGNGRNSLAVGVLKPSGLNCQWTTTWNRRSPDGGAIPALALLDSLTEQIRTTSTEPGVSSSLIYRIRDSLSRLCGWESWQPGDWGPVLPGLDLRALIRAELHRSLSSRLDDAPGSDAEELAGHVFGLLTPSRADGGEGETAEAGVDALLLAKFLANPEEE